MEPREAFKGTKISEFLEYFELEALNPLMEKLSVDTVEGLVEMCKGCNSDMNILEDLADASEYEKLMRAVESVEDKVSEMVPYSLRSGNRIRSGKRKKCREEERYQDPYERDMRKKKNNIRSLHAQLKKAASLDLVILLDCTGSMTPCLENIQSHIISLVNTVGNLHPDSNMRLAFVGYHHVSNTIPNKKQYIQRFTHDVNMFVGILQKLYTSGGGFDCLADVAGGLNVVSELDWKSTTRILFHIGDMPCHGRKYHECTLRDDYPDGDPNGISMEKTLEVLYNANVEYYFGRLCSQTDMMIQVFNDYIMKIELEAETKIAGYGVTVEELDLGAEKDLIPLNLSNSKHESSLEKDCEEKRAEDMEDSEDNSTDGTINLYVKTIDISDPGLLLSTITGKVTESMTTSLSTSFSTHTSLGDLQSKFGGLNFKTPSWQHVTSESGIMYDIPLPENMDQLFLEPVELLEAQNVSSCPDNSISSLQQTIAEATNQSYDNKPISDKTSSGLEEVKCYIKLGAAPFARGSCRNSYKARALSISPQLPRLRSGKNGSNKETQCQFDLTGVVKLPLQNSRKKNSFSQEYAHALNSQHAYAVASFMAKSFNSELRSKYDSEQTCETLPTIMYNPVTLLYLPERTASQQFATIEHDITISDTTKDQSFRYSEGFFDISTCQKNGFDNNRDCLKQNTSTISKLHFEKYNGNHGLCPPIPTPKGTDHSLVQAFSHWTYEKSRKSLMVVDCQGVFQPLEEGGGIFVLTDPAIHADNVMKFGGTNLGVEGIKRFFSTHRCNQYCKALKITDRHT